MCSYERADWLGSRDLDKRAGNYCRMNTSAWLAGWILPNSTWMDGYPDGVVLLCLSLFFSFFFSHHKHAIWLQWYSYKSWQSYDRRESYNFVLAMFLEFRARTRPQGLAAFSHLGNRAKNFSYKPKAKLVPVTVPAQSTGLMWRAPKCYKNTEVAESFCIKWPFLC